MPGTPHDDQRWLVWGADATVEYQIADDLLRIRRWENGQPRVSGWLTWAESTDATIRKHVRAMKWGALPQQRRMTGTRQKKPRYKVLIDWFRHHLSDPAR